MRLERAAVLVVGGGGAGLRAALAASEALGRAGLDPGQHPVVLATKGRLGYSGVTALACSDRMAFHATLPYTAPGGDDNWRFHAADIYRIGGSVSDSDLAEILAHDAADAVQYLADLGVPFVRKPDGRFDQFVTDGSEYPRALYTGPHTANHIEAALVGALRRSPVRVWEETMLLDVVLDSEGRVTGAYLLDGSQELVYLAVPAVVLATGGAGEAFAINVFPPGQTGDGYAVAYRAGAALVNLEFIQIGLCSTATKLACSGSMMRAIPRFVNDRGEEFLARYFPVGTSTSEIAALVFRKGATWPVSYEHPTHRIDVAVYQEVLAGRRVYLDYSRNPEGFDFAALPDELRARYETEAEAARASAGVTEEVAGGAGQPDGSRDQNVSPLARLAEINPPVLAWFAKRSIRIADGDRVQIAPSIQHFQGGVKIDRQGESTVPGLFAAGETAGGQHGANRPGGNALLDAQVFGRIAGEAAAQRAVERGEIVDRMPPAELPEIVARVSGTSGRPATEARHAAQEILYRSAGVMRTAEGLAAGLTEIAELVSGGFRRDEKGLAYAVETENLLLAAEMTLRACARRPESRGPHLYFPELTPGTEALPRRDPEGQRYLVVCREAGRMTVEPADPVR